MLGTDGQTLVFSSKGRWMAAIFTMFILCALRRMVEIAARRLSVDIMTP